MPRIDRKMALLAAGLALLMMVGVGLFSALRPARVQQNPGAAGSFALTTIAMADAPADVQDAAARLMYARIGYAMPRGDRTYLIISTGSDSLKVRIDGAKAQPNATAPQLVDVDLSTSAAGQRMIIASAPYGGQTEYQFNLDGMAASIPTLHNFHGLPLVTLPDGARFVAINPEPNQAVGTQSITVRGYARVFEAAFTVRAVTAKGRVLGEAHVMAAGGAPAWGSFVAELRLDSADLPETGFLILEESMTEAKLVIPVRFTNSGQLG